MLRSVKVIVTLVFLAQSAWLSAQSIIINEVSQGTGSAEYVELLVTGPISCGTPSCLDIRLWIFDDNNGNFAPGSGTGIAAGACRFADDPFWACIPAGTKIVIYNDNCTGCPNGSMPAQDLSYTDGDCQLVVPISSTLFDKHTSLPNSSNPNYSATGWVSGGSWTNISMNNSNDSFQILDPANTGTPIHAVSWGNNTTGTIISFGGSASGHVFSMMNLVDNNPNNQANWVSGSVPADETPGSNNGVANDAWITAMNYTCNPIVADTTFADVVCPGACDGEAIVNVSGGVPPYTYLWTPGNMNGATEVGLCPGTYQIVVYDANNCTDTTSVIISEPPAMVVNVTSTSNPTCGNSNGQIVVAGSGGTPGYTYSIDNITFQASGTFSGLVAGTYTVYMEDVNGCPISISVTLTNAAGVSATAAPLDVTCNGASDGQVTITAANGTAPYQYGLDGGVLGGANVFTGLSVGAHTVQVMDASGCTTTVNFTINEPPALTATITVTNVTCNGGADGELFCQVLNGTPPYTFLWPTGSTSATATGLGPGNYCATATDANGCTVTICETIVEPPAITVSTTEIDAACGATDGSITVTASGGDNGPYTYSIDGGAFGAGNVFNNIGAGNYSITVMDASGCLAAPINSVVSNLAAPIIDSVLFANPTCVGNADGSITIFASGGTGGFQYAINGGGLQASNVFNGLVAGTHNILIEDANGCQALSAVTLTDPTPITFTTAVGNLLCYQDASGTVVVNASGGDGNYQYSFNGSPLQASNTFNNLSAGTFTVLVEDGAGCQTSASVLIIEPNALVITSLITTDALCNGYCYGTALLTTSGGTLPYVYAWNDPLIGNTPAVTAMCAGPFTVTITDDNGCTMDSIFNINEPQAFAITTSTINADCNLPNGVATIGLVTGGTGAYTYHWDAAAGGGVDTFANGLLPGTYQVTITDVNACDTTISITIGNNAGIVPSLLASSDVTCYQSCDGYAEVTVVGGTAPYSYLWDNGVATSSVNTLCAGPHFCVITDAVGCSDTVFVTTLEPTEVLVQVSNDTTICAGSTLNLSGNASGGVPSYVLDWNAGQFTGSSITVGPSVQTAYTVIATDANGCASAPATVTIDMHPALQLNTFGDITICEGATVPIGAIASSGFGNYYYAWDSALGNAASGNVTPTVTTVYTVSVTDDCNAAPLQGQVTVTVEPAPQIAFTADKLVGCAPLEVNFLNTSASAAINCVWDFGDGTTSTDCNGVAHSYTTPGTYIVSFDFESPNGCSGLAAPDLVIEVSDDPIAAFDWEPQPVTLSNTQVQFQDLSIDATVYNWNFAEFGTSTAANPTFTFPTLMADEYEVCLEVMNPTGCIDSVCDTVIVIDEFSIYVPNAFTPNGDGVNDFFFPVMRSIDVSEFEFMIFNRWGEMIYQGFHPDQFWDGHVKGDMAQEDVYVWRIIVRDSVSGLKSSYTGHVSLLR